MGSFTGCFTLFHALHIHQLAQIAKAFVVLRLGDGLFLQKGIQGWICFAKEVVGFSLVNFPCYGNHPDIATISVRDEDLRIITKDEADDWINDRIKAEHEGK